MSKELNTLRNCLWLSELNRQAGVTPSVLRRIVNQCPDLDSLMSAGPDRIAEAMTGPPDKIIRLRAFIKNKRMLPKLDEWAASSFERGVRAVFFADDDFPSRLREISGCPPVLFYRGQDFASIMKQSYFVTIVGTRTPTPYGKMVSRQIAGELAERGIIVISGLARGIDAEVHRAVLHENKPTIAVVGCGPDLPYPPENAGLMEQIAETGLIISEHPPGVPPRKQHFPARNRILSGLADAVAVIEASGDSGTMITAGFAGEQGRDVFAVPGNILSPFSQGCNKLIREGAEVLTSAADILWRLPVGFVQTRIAYAAKTASGELDEADPAAQAIMALTGHAMTLTEMADSLDWPLSQTASILTDLEINGLVLCDRGRYSLTAAALCCNNS